MAQLTIQQAFNLALQHHQARRLQQAEQLYRQILGQQPEHVDAMHNLGVLAYQSGRNDDALKLFRRAIALRSNFADAYNSLGSVLKDNGQLDEAIAAHRTAITLKPDFTEAYNNLGYALESKEQFEQAIAALRQALVLRPNFAEAHNNLGIALQGNGQFDDAIAAYRKAIELRPNFPEAYANLGTALSSKGQSDPAIAAYQRAIALRPDFAPAHGNLGQALKDKGQIDAAIAAYRQAITINPNFAEAHGNLADALTSAGRLDEAIAAARKALAINPDLHGAHIHLGNALQRNGQFGDAISAYRQAIALKPDFAETYSNLGLALYGNGQIDQAIAAHRKAIALDPDLPVAHSNLGLSLLASRNFLEGWEEYEWRWKCKGFGQRGFAQPQWDGSPLEDRTLLLHAEQGYGDTIQFARYLPLVAERGGRVICECQAELQPLLQTIACGFQIIRAGDPLPAFDLHCPMLSLPRVFRTTLQNLPSTVPYLHPDGQDIQRWQHRLAEHSNLLKVGVAWAGRPSHLFDRQRSMKLEALAPLAGVRGVRFFSLHKSEDAQSQFQAAPANLDLVRWTEQRKDFPDTAALIANLDLVISVDTAVVHLAGAMCKPVWTLLTFSPDWRWMPDREDGPQTSPWYPSMRLFRQRTSGDWDGVISRVAEALAARNQPGIAD